MAEMEKVAINLPADLVRDAREFDLLTDEMVTRLLREAVDQRVNEIVNEEIHAYRQEKHSAK